MQVNDVPDSIDLHAAIKFSSQRKGKSQVCPYLCDL